MENVGCSISWLHLLGIQSLNDWHSLSDDAKPQNFCSAWNRPTGWAGLASQERTWLKEAMYFIVCRKQACHYRAISRIHYEPPSHRESFKYCPFFSEVLQHGLAIIFPAGILAMDISAIWHSSESCWKSRLPWSGEGFSFQQVSNALPHCSGSHLSLFHDNL